MLAPIFYKSQNALIAAAPPFQIETTSLGVDLVLGVCPEITASILLRCYKEVQGREDLFPPLSFSL